LMVVVVVVRFIYSGKGIYFFFLVGFLFSKNGVLGKGEVHLLTYSVGPGRELWHWGFS
jgi:hypothetical protein